MLADTMRAAEAVVAQCEAALDTARMRVSLMARVDAPAAAALAPAARELEELMAAARAQLDAAALAAAPGAAPASAAAPALVVGAPSPGAAPFVLAPGRASAPPPAAAAPAANGNRIAPRPSSAIAAEALTIGADGFQQVGSKKGRRPRA